MAIAADARAGPSPRVTRTLRNAVWSSGSWGITSLLTLLTTPFFVQKLTVEGYGVYALLTGLVGYYGLLDLGLGQGIIQAVAESRARGDQESTYSAIDAALLVQVVTGLIGSGALVFLSDSILSLLRVPPALLSDAKVGLYAAALGFFFTMLSGTMSSVVMGLERFDVSGAVNTTSSVLLTLVTVVVLYRGGGVGQVLIVTVWFAFAGCVAYFVAVRKLLRGWRFSLWVKPQGLRNLFSFSAYLFVSRLSSLFSTHLVRFIVSAILGPAAVTLYVVSWRLVNGFGGLLANASGVLFPYASALGAQKGPEAIRRVYGEASRLFASVSVPVYLVLAVFAEPILTLWVGPGLAQEAWPVLSLLSLSTLLGSLSTVPNLISMGLGYTKPIGLFSVASVAFYAVLLPVCTRQWGVEGTAWGMLGALAPGLVLVVFETEKIIGLRMGKYLGDVLAFHIIPILMAFLLMGWIRTAADVPASWMVVLALGSLCAYFGVMAASGWIPWRRLAGQLLARA
jgi:O-antigen/teichoic acid export membrane protein